MDKYEYKARAEEIRRLISLKQYREAVEIADTIDWRNVPSGMMLCTVSDLYKMCRRYEDSRDVLLLAYQRNPKGRMIIYSLCELSIKLDDVVNAVEYYKEYLQVAPRDTGRFILQYKLYEAQEASLEERISILEELQKRECKEKWMYELAFLYHRVGLSSSCVEECNQIIIFFGEGKYVIKALELKQTHEELPPDQKLLLDRLTGKAEEIQVQDLNVGQYNTVDIQKEIADNLKEVLTEDERKIFDRINEPTGVIEPVVVPEQLGEEIVEPEEPENVLEGELPVFSTTVDKDVTEIVMPDVEKSEEIAEESVEELAEEPVEEPAEEPSLEAENPNTDQVALTDTLIYSRDEVEKALGGSQVFEQTEEELKPVSIDEPFTPSNTETPHLNFEEILALEGDGQLSLVVPEQAMVEKQITGQLSIDEVLSEYERIRVENEKKWSEEIRSRITSSTDQLLKDFDKTSQNGLLEELEESVERDPDSVAYGPNLTEEEIIYLEEELTAQNEQVEENSEPTPQELFFDRTPYISVEPVNVEPVSYEAINADTVDANSETQEPDDKKPEPVNADNTAILSDEESDYLMKFAQAGHEKDLEEEAAIKAFEEAMEKMALEEEKKAQEKNTPEASEVSETKEVEEVEEIDGIDEIDEIQEAEAASEVSEAIEEPENSEEYEEQPGEEVEEEPEYEASEEPSVDPYFTDEQYARFESFIQTETSREQVIDALEGIKDISSSGNVIIGSTDIDSAIELGRQLIIEESKKGVISGKAAKIKASSLNAKDAEATLSKVYDGAIIIQDAEELRKETLEGIKNVLAAPDKKMLVIMTMSHRQKHRFIMENSEALEAFTVSIDIEALDNAELVKLAKEYAYQREFAIDEMGMLALHRRIDEKQTNSHTVLLTEVKEMVDKAMEHASKKNMGHFFELLLGKRYDENDMIILGEKDFSE